MERQRPGGQCPPPENPPAFRLSVGLEAAALQGLHARLPALLLHPRAGDRGRVRAAGLAFDPQEHGIEPESHPLGPSSGQRVGAKTPQEAVEGAGAKETPSSSPGKPGPEGGRGLRGCPESGAELRGEWGLLQQPVLWRV